MSNMKPETKAAFRAAVREVEAINHDALREKLAAAVDDSVRLATQVDRVEKHLREANDIIEYFIACRRPQGWRLVSPGTSDEPSLWIALEKAKAYMAGKEQNQ